MEDENKRKMENGGKYEKVDENKEGRKEGQKGRKTKETE